jgi:putative FmdB family regulatory protein
MPIYEYSCKKCGAHVEAMQKISDKPLTRHAKCGGKLEKEWSRTGFQFKGTGWYVTDYAGKKGEAKDGKESKSEAKESKSESKESKSDSSSTGTSDSKKPKASSASAPASGD